MHLSKYKYSSNVLFIYSIVLFILLFAGRGLSLGNYLFNVSYGTIIAIPSIIFFSLTIKFKNSSNYIFLLFIITVFIMYGYLSLFYTKSFYYGLDKIFNLSAFILVTWIFTSALNKHQIIKVFKFIILISLPLATIYILLNISTGFQSRQGLLGAGSITTGRIFSFACISTFYFALKDRNKKMYMLFAVFLVAVFLSGSRGNFLFLILAIVLPWVINNFRVIIKPLIVFVGLCIFLVSSSLIEKLPFFYRYSLLFDGGGDSILVRFEAYTMALRLFLENPFFGVGIGGYSYYSLGYDSIDYPHNIFMEIGAELGSIGLFLFLLVCLFSFFITIKNHLLLSIFIFYFLVSMGSGDLFDARILFVIALINQSFNRE